MKSTRKNLVVIGLLTVLMASALFLTVWASPSAHAQTGHRINGAQAGGDETINPPPFDFNDNFYTANGINVQELDTAAGQRFGLFRKTGPPAGPGQVNWVLDPSNTDPDRNNVRILATTGGYRDDSGSPTQFISIIAFLTDQNFFAGGANGVPNARGLTLQQIVGGFEAYAGVKQVAPDGVFHPTPCASIGVPGQPCFSVASVATPNLRQDWRFSTNRNAIDGSAPLSYNGDNLLGMWIITYFWFNDAGFGPHQTPSCKAALNFLAQKNGLSLDGTPIIKTGAELHFVESALAPNEVRDFPPPPQTPCANEGNLAVDGSDGGAVWLICPAIPDPTQGGIAPDAFVDTVRKPDGTPVDPQISASFNCLQRTGQFCPLVNGKYTVKNQTSGLFWDDHRGSTTPGTLVGLVSPNRAARQEWTFTLNAEGTYTIINQASGLALDDPNASAASGTRLVQNTPNGASSQKWIVKSLTNGFTIQNFSSNLAVDAAVNTPGTFIRQATPTGAVNQLWVIRFMGD